VQKSKTTQRLANDFITPMNRTLLLLVSCILLIGFSQTLHAQEVNVTLGADEVAANQFWQITITVENERLKSYSPFPEIDGLMKRGTSSSTSTQFINGKMTSSQSIIQNYAPQREGNILVKDFTMTINGETVNVRGKNITVSAPNQNSRQRATDPYDPFGDLFNRRRSQQPTEFVDVEAEAFLALTTDKTEVYVGEGFTTTLAFYVSESNRADMRFYDLGNQLTEIVKQIKPDNCWEENFQIDNINGEPVEIGGKGYTQYKVFQATYYPLNNAPISFPRVGLKLIKYKMAKNPSFFGRNRQEDFETFYSKPKTINILELPAHPLKDRVAVGNYRLQDKINATDLNTGQSFSYQFNIVGEGNISAIENPLLADGDVFDFYDPNVTQNIRRSSNTVRGTKNFDYYGIPNEPGQYALGDYLYWVYFNPVKEEYDTLKSDYIVNVAGESRKNEYISSSDLGSFYDQMEFTNNDLISLSGTPWIQILLNVFIFATLGFSVYLVFKK
jgi:hypothetical protein